jgi:prepilin-type processing-associated H-X9-DG protein
VIAVAEKWLRPSKYATGDGTGAMDQYGYAVGWTLDTVRMATFAPARDAESAGNGAWDNSILGSAHIGSFNVVYADGSVRGIRYSISWTLLNQLSDRRDGAVINWSQVE